MNLREVSFCCWMFNCSFFPLIYHFDCFLIIISALPSIRKNKKYFFWFFSNIRFFLFLECLLIWCDIMDPIKLGYLLRSWIVESCWKIKLSKIHIKLITPNREPPELYIDGKGYWLFTLTHLIFFKVLPPGSVSTMSFFLYAPRMSVLPFSFAMM